MLRQLITFLILLTVLSVAFTFMLRAVVPFPVDVLLGFLGAFLVIYATSALREAAQIGRDITLVRNADKPVIAKDGQRVAAVGRLMPTGSPLKAPFSRRECVYYRYAASSKTGNTGGSEPVSGDYSGLALTPSSVRSAVRETRLIGVPMMQGFEDETRALTWDEHYKNAESYVAETRFEVVSLGDIALMLKSVKTTLEDDDGSVRRDVKLEGAGSIRDSTLREMVVPSGSEVCVVGTWSSDHAGLIQKLGSREMLTLYEGGASNAIEHLKKTMTGHLTGGFIGLGVVAGFVAWRFLAV